MENTNETKAQQQTPVQQDSKKWYQHKGFITILVLAVIAAVAIWVYFILNQPQTFIPIVEHHKTKLVQQQATSTPPQADTSSLQTYTNNQYGFGFSYSNNWTQSDFNQNEDCYSSGLCAAAIFSEATSSGTNAGINLYIYNNFTNAANFNSWHQSNLASNALVSTKVSQIGSNKVIMTQEEDGIDSEGEYAYIPNGNLLVMFIDDTNDSGSQTELQQILSTFQFTNQSQTTTQQVLSPTSSEISTTNWKIYTSDGLTFALPPITPPWEVNYIPGSYGNLFRIDIGAVDPVNNEYTSVIGLFGLPNTSKESLQTWFESNVDDASSTLFTSGAFQKQQLPNGEAFVNVGAIPATYGGGPVAQAYVLSPSGTSIYSITQSQDGSLTDFGYPAASIPGMLIAILGSVH